MEHQNEILAKRQQIRTASLGLKSNSGSEEDEDTYGLSTKTSIRRSPFLSKLKSSLSSLKKKRSLTSELSAKMEE